MQSDEQHTYNNQSRRPNKRFELFFFETVGNRSYLRFTRLAVVLILCFTVIPIAAILTLFLYNQASINSEEINVNVRSAPRTNATPLRNVIIQTPTPQPVPKVHRQPLQPAPSLPALPPEYSKNTNGDAPHSTSPPSIKSPARNSNER